MKPHPRSPRRKASKGEPTSPDPLATAGEDEEAKLFYQHLEQAGQLVDVDDGADLSSLSSRVTHVRRPDGSVERIGFSAY